MFKSDVTKWYVMFIYSSLIHTYIRIWYYYQGPLQWNVGIYTETTPLKLNFLKIMKKLSNRTIIYEDEIY